MTAWETLITKGRILPGIEIGGLTTYKMGGSARWYCEPGSVDDAKAAIAAAAEHGIEILVLGRGSNLVVSDRGYDGLVIRLAGQFRSIHIDPNKGRVRAGAAVALPVLARQVARVGLASLEFYVGIPGSVGGAVMMNAGFFGSETSDVLLSATILDMETGEVSHRKAADLALGYRTSNVGPRDLILEAAFSVVPGSTDEVLERMREAIRWRRDNQPGGTLNAGSIFRNPPGQAAGRIIDELGLKGMRRGGVSVSFRHANFFVAESGAQPQDVYDLVAAVRRQVHDRTGILLQPEVRFVGRFSPTSDGTGASGERQ